RPAHALLGEIGRLPAAGDDPVPGRAARSRRGIPEASVIRWGAPHLLVLLVAVPIVLLLLLAAAWLKRRSLARLADPGLIPRLTDSRSPRLAAIKAACLLAGLALVIVALARPQWGEKLQVYKGRGIDIVIALDASKSMLAT